MEGPQGKEWWSASGCGVAADTWDLSHKERNPANRGGNVLLLSKTAPIKWTVDLLHGSPW